jgi:hypothetical protein
MLGEHVVEDGTYRRRQVGVVIVGGPWRERPGDGAVILEPADRLASLDEADGIGVA